jgi:hypothetical protein
MRTKKVQKSRKTFRSVGKSVGKSIGIRADGHVSDMHMPSVIPSVFDVGKAVGIRADEHVSDMRALRDVRQSVGDSVGIGRRYSPKRTRVIHACASGCATIRR